MVSKRKERRFQERDAQVLNDVFAARFQWIREHRKLTVYDLATKVLATPQDIRAWEEGAKPIPAHSLYLACRAFACQPNWILFGTDPPMMHGEVMNATYTASWVSSLQALEDRLRSPIVRNGTAKQAVPTSTEYVPIGIPDTKPTPSRYFSAPTPAARPRRGKRPDPLSGSI